MAVRIWRTGSSGLLALSDCSGYQSYQLTRRLLTHLNFDMFTGFLASENVGWPSGGHMDNLKERKPSFYLLT
jgi:hypothetical protein